MAERSDKPPGDAVEKPPRSTDPARAKRLKPEQYEIKIRWEKAKRVRKVSPADVQFDFDSALKVGARYPISVNGPGVAFSSTLEVTRCQVTVEPGGRRYFSVDGRFFPYVK